MDSIWLCSNYQITATAINMWILVTSFASIVLLKGSMMEATMLVFSAEFVQKPPASNLTDKPPGHTAASKTMLPVFDVNTKHIAGTTTPYSTKKTTLNVGSSTQELSESTDFHRERNLKINSDKNIPNNTTVTEEFHSGNLSAFDQFYDANITIDVLRNKSGPLQNQSDIPLPKIKGKNLPIIGTLAPTLLHVASRNTEQTLNDNFTDTFNISELHMKNTSDDRSLSDNIIMQNNSFENNSKNISAIQMPDLPIAWQKICSFRLKGTNLYKTMKLKAVSEIKRTNPIFLQCYLTSGYFLDFWDFRRFTSQTFIIRNFTLTIKCQPGAEIKLPWPMRAEKLVYLSVDGCIIKEYMSEYFNSTINSIPDTIKYLNLNNNAISIDMLKFARSSTLLPNMTHAAECGPENALEYTVRNMSYKFVKQSPATLKFIRKNFVSKTAREYHRGIFRTRNVCLYRNMYKMDRSVSTHLGARHDTILLQNSQFPVLTFFNLSHVRIRSIPDKFKEWRLFFPKLKYLDLSWNKIKDFWSLKDYGTSSEDSSLGTVDLTYNNITTVSLRTLRSIKNHRYLVVNIRDNPFQCNCEMRDFVEYFRKPNDFSVIGKKPQYDYLRRLRCHSPEHLKGKIIITLTIKELGCDLGTTTILTAPIVALCILVVLLVAVIVVVVRYRKEIVILAFTRLNIVLPCQKTEDHANKTYDAFIAYSQNDAEWVLRTLVPRLEHPNNGPAFKLCLHHRDFAVGAAIADNIVQSIEASKHTVLIVSDNFLNSEWCLMEFRTAFHQSLLEKKRHLIIVMLEDLPANKIDADLKRCMQTLTYVRLDDRWFWDKIIYAISEVKKRKNKHYNDNIKEEQIKAGLANEKNNNKGDE